MSSRNPESTWKTKEVRMNKEIDETWYKLSEVSPPTKGSYLVLTNDDRYLLCQVSINGWWSVIPNPKFLGDMGGQVTINSKRVDREVIWWREKPALPNNYDPYNYE